MGSFLIFVGLLAMLAGFVSLFVPLKFLKITSRKMGALVLLIGFVVATIGGGMIGGGQSTAPAPTSAPASTTPASTTPASTATQTKTAQPAQPPAPKKPNLELIESHVEVDQFARYIVGTVKNNTNRTYSYVQVEINLYDDSGAQVGSTVDNTNNLEPGGVWKFKALIFDSDATKYKVKEIRGF